MRNFFTGKTTTLLVADGGGVGLRLPQVNVKQGPNLFIEDPDLELVVLEHL